MPYSRLSPIVNCLSLMVNGVKNRTIHHKPSTINQKGFTLVEILISVAIIAMLGIVVIPNVRRFSEDEALKNETSRLIQVLHQVQSNSQSSVVCSNIQPSKDWFITLGNSPSTSYSVQADCCASSIDCSSPTPNTATVYNLASSVTLTSASCTKIIFLKNTVDLTSCSSSITLHNSVTGNNTTILINAGGAIYEQ